MALTVPEMGAAGSGKSYSMVGYGKNKGIVPISCEEIFRRIASDHGNSYEVLVSAIEIYNEAVQDLKARLLCLLTSRNC